MAPFVVEVDMDASSAPRALRHRVRLHRARPDLDPTDTNWLLNPGPTRVELSCGQGGESATPGRPDAGRVSRRARAGARLPLLELTGISLTGAARLLADVGDIHRFRPRLREAQTETTPNIHSWC